MLKSVNSRCQVPFSLWKYDPISCSASNVNRITAQNVICMRVLADAFAIYKQRKKSRLMESILSMPCTTELPRAIPVGWQFVLRLEQVSTNTASTTVKNAKILVVTIAFLRHLFFVVCVISWANAKSATPLAIESSLYTTEWWFPKMKRALIYPWRVEFNDVLKNASNQNCELTANMMNYSFCFIS